MKSPVFAGSGGGGRERAERMIGARQESMLATLEMVDRKWGGAEGYIKNLCGLTDAEIEKVRTILAAKERGAWHKRLGSMSNGVRALLGTMRDTRIS
jgi:hypothetical protein